MNKKAILIAGIIAAGIAVGFYIYSQNSRNKAIELAKKSYAFGSYVMRVEHQIKSWLEKKKGNLKIIGWQAQKINDQTYLVSYTFDEGSGTRGYFFEVNLVAGIVRYVSDDPELEKKYGFQ